VPSCLSCLLFGSSSLRSVSWPRRWGGSWQGSGILRRCAGGWPWMPSLSRPSRWWSGRWRMRKRGRCSESLWRRPGAPNEFALNEFDLERPAAGGRPALTGCVASAQAAFGAKHPRRPISNRRQVLADVILWPFDSATAEAFGGIPAEQKAKGRPISPLDAQIAAVARRHDLVLLTADRCFSFVTWGVVEHWPV